VGNPRHENDNSRFTRKKVEKHNQYPSLIRIQYEWIKSKGGPKNGLIRPYPCFSDNSIDRYLPLTVTSNQ